jgi:hypothetical protein
VGLFSTKPAGVPANAGRKPYADFDYFRVTP